MHGLATIRRINGEPYLTVEEREAAARSAAAKPVTPKGKDLVLGGSHNVDGGADMAKPAEYPNRLDRSV